MTDIAIDAYDRQIENRQNRVHERVDPDLWYALCRPLTQTDCVICSFL